MAKSFDIIRAAEKQSREQQTAAANIAAHLAHLSESAKVEPKVIGESVLNLLANLATKAESGQEMDLMHTNSIAAFLAGVETIANALPVSKDQEKKENTLRALALAGMDSSGMINNATFPIVNLGARKSALHKQWATKLAGDTQTVAQSIRRLQMSIDRAMRMAMNVGPMEPTAASMPGVGGHA